jgi:hypothetical protein
MSSYNLASFPLQRYAEFYSNYWKTRPPPLPRGRISYYVRHLGEKKYEKGRRDRAECERKRKKAQDKWKKQVKEK